MLFRHLKFLLFSAMVAALCAACIWLKTNELALLPSLAAYGLGVFCAALTTRLPLFKAYYADNQNNPTPTIRRLINAREGIIAIAALACLLTGLIFYLNGTPNAIGYTLIGGVAASVMSFCYEKPVR